MKNKIKDLYEYFKKRNNRDFALEALMMLYCMYKRYNDIEKMDREYDLIEEVVNFANQNSKNVKYVYSEEDREKAYQDALKQFVKQSTIDEENFEMWLKEANRIKDKHNCIFDLNDVMVCQKDKTFELYGFNDFLEILFDTERFDIEAFTFIKSYSQYEQE